MSRSGLSRHRPASRRYRFADFELDGSRGELRRRGRRLRVEPKVIDVLTYLVAHRERTVSVEELLGCVWRGVAVERGSVYRAVRLLRRALEAEAGGPAIENVPLRGYRFLLDAHEIAAERPTGDVAHYVGRNALCAELDQRLERALGGRTELLLLHGPAGIGKSATLDRVARRAESAGARVFEGRSIEGPGAAPYRPWSRILRAAIRADGAREVVSELGAGAADLARAMPEIGALLGVGAQPEALRDAGGRDCLYDVVSDWICRRCRKAPLVLLFDDLHRADLDSVRLLASVTRALGDERLLLAAAHRDGPDASAVMDSIAGLAALRPDAALRLGKLSREEIRELAFARTGERLEESQVERLAGASGGNPLFLEQLLRVRTKSGDAVGGPGLRGVLRRLLEDASPACAEVLAQACVFGRELDAAVVAASLARPQAEIRNAISEACALHLLEPAEEGAGLRFVHGLIPEVLYAGLSEAERIERHRRALDGILATRLHARDRLGELAHHAREAASLIGAAQAFDHVVAAARNARDRLAYEEAVEIFERALSLRERDRPGEEKRATCLVELATLMVLLGDAMAARPRFFEACELARELGDPLLFARAALGPSQVEEYDELDRTQVAALREAVERLGDRDRGLRVELLIALARTGYYADPELVLDATAEALAIARCVGEPELVCRSALARASALGWMPVRADCRELVEEANRLATRGPVSPLVEGAALLHAARENLAAGDRVGFERALRRLETLAEAYRLAYFDWSLAMLRGTRALLEGRFGEARELVRHQTERGRRANPLLAFQVEAIHDTMIGLAVDARESVVEELRRLAERFPEISPWRASLAMALAACGHRTEAAAEVENLIRGGLRPRHRDFLPIVLATLAQAVQRLGDARLAGVVAGELALLEDRSVVVGACFAGYGAVDRYRGLCAEAAGDAGAAVALFASGLQIDEAMGALPFVACGCFDLGRALRLRGEPEDADASEQQIGRALALASALGMRSLEDDIGDWAASQSARPETDRGNLEQQ